MNSCGQTGPAVRISYMMNRMSGYVPILAVACVVCASCGYTTRSTLPAKYRTVAVPAFRSDVYEPDLQPAVTNALRRRIVLDGRLRLAGPADADLILRGRLTEYEVSTLTELRDDEPAQVSVRLRAEVELEDRLTGDVLWRDKSLAGSSRHFRRGVAARTRSRGTVAYFADDLTSFPSAEQGQSTAEAIEDLATSILYRLVEY